MVSIKLWLIPSYTLQDIAAKRVPVEDIKRFLSGRKRCCASLFHNNHALRNEKLRLEKQQSATRCISGGAVALTPRHVHLW